MAKFIAFTNAFLSYLLLFALILALAAGAVCLGIYLRKNKDRRAAGSQAEKTDEKAAGQ